MRILIATAALAFLTACGNQQPAAVTTAAIVAVPCVVTLATDISGDVNSTGSNFNKALSSATTAAQDLQSAACKAAIQNAVTAVQAAAAPAPAAKP